MTTSWWGYSVPHLQMVKMRGGETPISKFENPNSEKVFGQAKKVLKTQPEITAREVLTRAADGVGVKLYDLPPEDVRALEIAVHWEQTGRGEDEKTVPAGVSTRSGVYSGGSRSSAYGHSLVGRGAP